MVLLLSIEVSPETSTLISIWKLDIAHSLVTSRTTRRRNCLANMARRGFLCTGQVSISFVVEKKHLFNYMQIQHCRSQLADHVLCKLWPTLVCFYTLKEQKRENKEPLTNTQHDTRDEKLYYHFQYYFFSCCLCT